MIQISPQVFEAAGFEKIPDGTEVKAMFNLVRAYHVEGIILEESGASAIENMCHKNQDFTFGFGNNLNELSQYLFDEDLVDDDWIKENNVTSPFLIIHISLNEFFSCKSGYWKKETIKDEKIISIYDGFPEARELLKKKESRIISKAVASLSVSLSDLHYPIRFKSILRQTYGKTELGEMVFDIRAEMSGEIFTLVQVHPLQVKVRIQDSLKLYNQLDDQVRKHLYSALGEKDKLKQFLNFFFVLEIHTNQVFKNIKFQDYVSEANNIPDRIKESGEKFLLKLWKSECEELAVKFQWCALLAWKKIDDKDIEDFKSMKKIRDRIAHGEIVSEDKLLIDLAQKLCMKILSSSLLERG